MIKKFNYLRIFLLLSCLVIGISLDVMAVSWPNDLPAKREFPQLVGKNITIKIWTHDPLYIKWFSTTSKEFNQLYPDINIKGEMIQIGSDQKLLDKMTSTIVAGKGQPDIVGVNWLLMSRIWRKGLYRAFKPLPLKKEGLFDKFYYSPLATAQRPGTDKIYALPSDVPVTVLWYREDILKEVGADLPIDTWDEFIKIGKKVTRDLDGDGKIDRWMTVVADNPNQPLDGFIAWYANILMQRGGNLFDASGNITIDNKEGIEAAQFVQNLVNKWKIALPVESVNGAQSGQAIFKASKAATMPDATWYLDYLMKAYYPEQAGKWRAQPLPAFKKGGQVDLADTSARTARLGGTYMTILKSDHDDLVWEFLKYSYASSQNLIRYWNMTHYLPTTKKALASTAVTQYKSDYLGGQNLGQLYSELVPDMKPLYTNEKMTFLLTVLQERIPELIKGKISAADWAKEVADQARNME